jgi:hypothetical protein
MEKTFMSWSKRDAEAFINGTKTYDDLEGTSQPSDQSAESNAEPSVSETATDEPQKPVTEDNTAGQETQINPEKVDETTDKEKQETSTEHKSKTRFTKEQQQQHAFAKEKAKRRALQQQLVELQDKLKKYEGLTKEDFKGDEEAYNDYKIDRRFDSEKINQIQNELNQQDQEDMIQRAKEKEVLCFPDEENLNKYHALINKAETNFRSLHQFSEYNTFSEMLLSENDQTVIKYLQDSANAPKLIKHFIYKPEAFEAIKQLRNPLNKMIELKQLENRLLIHERMQGAKTTQLNVKRELPNTGKITQNNKITNQDDLFSKTSWSKKDAERYIREHQ